MTKRPENRGRTRSYTDAQARKAYELYIVKGLAGKAVAEKLGRPRTTVIEMANYWVRVLEAKTA